MVDFTKLSKPLKKLSDASLKIAEGDYTSRVEGFTRMKWEIWLVHLI